MGADEPAAGGRRLTTLNNYGHPGDIRQCLVWRFSSSAKDPPAVQAGGLGKLYGMTSWVSFSAHVPFAI